eukprot:1519774-Lingulodinium_polyedra.AAC.1
MPAIPARKGLAQAAGARGSFLINALGQRPVPSGLWELCVSRGSERLARSRRLRCGNASCCLARLVR